jgi:hypothetical protein
MAKQFDATLNTLLDAHAADWAAYLAARVGIPPGPAVAEETDLSLTVQADKVFRINGPTPALVHLELESSSHLGIPLDLLRYNVLLHHSTGLPVHSVLVLLRPRANASDQNGVYTAAGANGPPYLTFHYHVIRVWEEPFDSFLAAGVGLAPLAVLTDEAAADLPAAFGRFVGRLQQPDVPTDIARNLLGSSYTLFGLRYNAQQISDLFRSLSMTLEDSSTYQLILQKGIDKGRAEAKQSEAVAILLRQGRRRFPVTPTDAEQRLKAVNDVDRLERMADRMFDAADWDDLLSTP